MWHLLFPKPADLLYSTLATLPGTVARCGIGQLAPVVARGTPRRNVQVTFIARLVIPVDILTRWTTTGPMHFEEKEQYERDHAAIYNCPAPPSMSATIQYWHSLIIKQAKCFRFISFITLIPSSSFYVPGPADSPCTRGDDQALSSWSRVACLR